MSTDCQTNGPVRFNRFLDGHAVFTVDELDYHLTSRGSSNTNTRNSLLAYHRRQGRIVRVRRGLYATVPRGMDPASMTVDPYLVAAKMTGDAVLAYHTALEFHGRAYSAQWRQVYVSARKSLPLTFQAREFRGVPVPPVGVQQQAVGPRGCRSQKPRPVHRCSADAGPSVALHLGQQPWRSSVG